MNRRLLPLLSLLLALTTALTSRAFDDDRAVQSIVRVHSFRPGLADGHGTGFILNRQGIVATNHHVIDGGKAFLVIEASGGQICVSSASLVASDSDKDLAILRVDKLRGQPVVLGEGPIRSGTEVVAMGFPGLLDNARTRDRLDKIVGAPVPSDDVIAVYIAAQKAAAEKLKGKGNEAISKEVLLLLQQFMQKQTPEAQAVRAYLDEKRRFLEGLNRGFSKTVPADADLEEFVRPTVFYGRIGKIVHRPWMYEDRQPVKILEHDAKIGSGNSGGPLFNECNQVVGVNTQGWTVDLGTERSSSINELVPILQKHGISYGSAPQGCTSQSGWLYLSGGAVLLLAAAWIVVSRIRRREGAHSPPRREVTSPPPERDRTIGICGRLEGLTPNGPVSFAFGPAAFAAHDGRLILGRSATVADLVIDHPSLSRQHATLAFREGALFLIDRGSANGTSVNGNEVRKGTDLEEVRLSDGDAILLGEVRLTLRLDR